MILDLLCYSSLEKLARAYCFQKKYQKQQYMRFSTNKHNAGVLPSKDILRKMQLCSSAVLTQYNFLSLIFSKQGVRVNKCF